MSVAARHYDSILSPVITEKSTILSENNQVVFEVPVTATKPDIKEAVRLRSKVKPSASGVLPVAVKISKKPLLPLRMAMKLILQLVCRGRENGFKDI